MSRFRCWPAGLLALLLTAGICWGQQSAMPAQTADEACEDCCSDCAAEWIPILVDDCLKMWSLLWELGSYSEAASLADEAWRLDPSNIGAMHARTLSHIVLAFSGATAKNPAKPQNAFSNLATEGQTTWMVGNIGCGNPVACSMPANACGVTCAQAARCSIHYTASCPAACSVKSNPPTGSTCGTTACCTEKPTACGTCSGALCTAACPKAASCGACGSAECCTAPKPCGACSTAKSACCCEAKCCTKKSCACAKDCSCCSSKCACGKDCNCGTGKCCCAKNTCACEEVICVLLDQIFALLNENRNQANAVAMPAPCMPRMPCWAPPAPPMMAPQPAQPVCMPGMPCPGMLMSRPMEPQLTPRAPVPPPPAPVGPHWVVGEVLANPPVIQVPKEDVKIHVTPHGKRIHVDCDAFEAVCDHLTTCDGGERLILEGNVRVSMQTGNKPGKISAQRVEVYVPDGSVGLVPDCSVEKPLAPMQYSVPSYCPPSLSDFPN